MLKDWRALVPVWTMLVDRVQAAADDLSDLSNNLATDVGPLLILFGEAMTKQYLSESTTFLDYFIFAMGPIGILTAVVSTIRLCGSNSLRAFIGRSQEGDAVVEAELCTSTSRDVCELFNKGGITRVFGHPTIAEFIHVPAHQDWMLDHSFMHFYDGDQSVQLFRAYLDRQEAKSADDRRVRRRRRRETQKRSAVPLASKPNPSSDAANEKRKAVPLAPKPNLSLNVGIKKRPRWMFLAVASMGFILQVGIVVLAGVGVWILGWNLAGDESASGSRDYAPSMYILGTILMCLGMWSCAALVGQSTHEVRHNRRDPRHGWGRFQEAIGDEEQPKKLASPTRLIWVQPGPQVVGDQNFDPCVFLESEKEPILEWTSSIKDMRRRYQTHTYFAISAVILGYISQFIGLRGMKAWVSMAQLGVTIFMSVLRGLLRIRRMTRGDNRLAKMPDLVAGHELDWLAFELAMPRKENQAPPAYMMSHHFCGSSQEPRKDDTYLDSRCEDLLKIRARLAHLTGVTPFLLPFLAGESERLQWSDDMVLVRATATRLSLTIEKALKSLYTQFELGVPKGYNRLPQGHGRVFIPTVLIPDARANPVKSQTAVRYLAELELDRPWNINTAMIESILGLWLWSIKSDPRAADEDEFGNTVTLKKAKIYRAIAPRPLENDRTVIMQDDGLGYGWHPWYRLRGITPFYRVRPEGNSVFSLGTIWQTVYDPEDHSYLTPILHRQSNDDSMHGSPTRICGLTAIQQYLETQANPKDHNDGADIELLTIQLSNPPPLIDICAQELFTMIMRQVVATEHLDRDMKVDWIKEGDDLRFQNDVLSNLISSFVDGGLGNSETAMQCILPSLWDELSMHRPEKRFRSAMACAERFRQQSRWEEAEYALETMTHSSDRLVKHRALSKVLEIRRERASRLHDSTSWSADEFRFAASRYKVEKTEEDHLTLRAPEDREEVPEDPLHGVYLKVAAGLDAVEERNIQDLQTDAMASLVEACRIGDRVAALHYLCFLVPNDFKTPRAGVALCYAVQHEWEELIDTLLRLGVDPDSIGEDGRAALHYTRWLPSPHYSITLRLLIEHGASSCPSAPRHLRALVEASAFGDENLVNAVLNPHSALAHREYREEYTPLSKALSSRLRDVFMHLLDIGADVNYISPDGKTLFSTAVAMKDRDAMQILLERGARVNPIHDRDAPMLAAVQWGDLDLMGLLINAGAKLDPRNDNGETPLFQVLCNDRKDMAELLLKAGANIDAKGGEGKTQLSLAVETRDSSKVSYLLNMGANVHARDNDGRTPLSWAAERGDLSIVTTLIEAGARINTVSKAFRGLDSRQEMTPLMYAVRGGHEAAVDKLLAAGANVHLFNLGGQTALWLAAFSGKDARYSIVQKLLDAGAATEIDKKDENGDCPAWETVHHEDRDMLKLLIAAGADVNVQDNVGATLLYFAAFSNDLESVKILVQAGANLEIRLRKGSTSLAQALESTNHDIARYLLEQGADYQSIGQEDHPIVKAFLASESKVVRQTQSSARISPPKQPSRRFRSK